MKKPVLHTLNELSYERFKKNCSLLGLSRSSVVNELIEDYNEHCNEHTKNYHPTTKETNE